MTDRIKISLGGTNAYMYRKFKVQAPKRSGRRWRWCPCLFRRGAGDANGCASIARDPSDAVPKHAAALFVDGPEVDKSWAVVLTEAQLGVMTRERQTSIYVFSRQYHTPVFQARLETSGAGGRSVASNEWDVARDRAVQEVLRVCLVNGQPSDGVIVLPNNRRYMLRSVPMWNNRDALVGLLWSVAPAVAESSAGRGKSASSLHNRRRAAVYYDATTRLFVLNETWLRHRNLVADVMSVGEEHAVLMTDPEGRIEAARNLDTAGNVVIEPNLTRLQCAMDDVLLPAVAAQVNDAIRQLRDDAFDPNGGRVTNGVTGGPLGDKGYTITITKVVVGVEEHLTGFVVSIAQVESLGNLVSSMRPPSLESVVS